MATYKSPMASRVLSAMKNGATVEQDWKQDKDGKARVRNGMNRRFMFNVGIDTLDKMVQAGMVKKTDMEDRVGGKVTKEYTVWELPDKVVYCDDEDDGRKEGDRKITEDMVNNDGPVEPSVVKNASAADLYRLHALVLNTCDGSISAWDELLDDYENVDKFVSDLGGLNVLKQLTNVYRNFLDTVANTEGGK